MRPSANPRSRSCQSLTTTRDHGRVMPNISTPPSRTRVPERDSWIVAAPIPNDATEKTIISAGQLERRAIADR